MREGALASQVAIVTGAGSRGPGIGNGRAAAVLLAEAGAHVVVVDSLIENLDVTCRLIEERGGSFMPVVADVSRLGGCEAVVQQAVGAYGRLDILVNNVGIGGPPGSVVDVDLEAWDSCFRVNLTSMLLMARCAIPHMRAAASGSIINLSSVAGLLGGHPHVAYSTTKAAIVGLTRTMAATHAPEGIRVNAIAPGMVYTPMIQGPGFSDAERELRRIAAPLQTEGTGWDVGAAVVFLASPAARWITGVILPVDAGLSSTLGQAQAIYSRIANAAEPIAHGSAK